MPLWTLVRAGTKLRNLVMTSKFPRVPHPRLLIAGVAVILFGTSGTAAVMAWMPGSADIADEVVALDGLPPPSVQPVDAEAQMSTGPTPGDVRSRVKCEECGTVASVREIAQPGGTIERGATRGVSRDVRNDAGGQPIRHYEVTVRMQDGSKRVFMQAVAVNWRAGERLLLIADRHPAGN